MVKKLRKDFVVSAYINPNYLRSWSTYIRFKSNFRGYLTKWRILVICFWALAVAMLPVSAGLAQVPPGGGQVSIPSSSTEQPGDIGVRGHTNIQIFTPKRAGDDAQAPPGGGGAAPRPPPGLGPGTGGPGGSTRPQ
jgi:hypothetical protein